MILSPLSLDAQEKASSLPSCGTLGFRHQDSAAVEALSREVPGSHPQEGAGPMLGGLSSGWWIHKGVGGDPGDWGAAVEDRTALVRLTGSESAMDFAGESCVSFLSMFLCCQEC